MGRGKSQASKQLIEAAYEILNEIQPASVRAVCYRLFTAGLIDSMSKSNTNRVSTQLVYRLKLRRDECGDYFVGGRCGQVPARRLK